MNGHGLYVFAYYDDENKMQTEYISAGTFKYATEQFYQIAQIKNIKTPIVKRVTVYERKEVINL